MLPLHQAFEVQESILAYLRATFGFREPAVRQAFDQFLLHPEQGILKGPYISIRLPFVRASESDGIPLTIRPPFPPFDHQLRAFRRLSTQQGHHPQPTLLTTGTGSGKTESFLYPILDYCYQNRHRRGIKAIILYPMNALATDQAGRVAEIIHSDDRLRGQLTAGLFIGLGTSKKEYSVQMLPDRVIENRDSILDSPPDILLTNFKMLDQALMRDQLARLWQDNEADPSLLQFLVLDELHTYDGAQGSDVANLIRRLRLRLNLPDSTLCPVGTSATLGSGPDALQQLCDYAGTLFGVRFDPATAVLTEKRLELDTFFCQPRHDLDDFIPRPTVLGGSQFALSDTPEQYRQRQQTLWQLPANLTPADLSRELLRLRVVYDLLSICHTGQPTLTAVLSQLAQINPDVARLSAAHQEGVVLSLLTLLSVAKLPDAEKFPLVYVQVHLWVRALSGVLREVGEQPVFRWGSNPTEPGQPSALPPWFCRDCGASGWLAVKHDNKNRFENDPADVYEKFISGRNNKHLYLINTNTEEHQPIDEFQATDALQRWVSHESLEFFNEPAPDHTKPGRTNLLALKRIDAKGRFEPVCPECGSRHTLALIGTGVATLSSVTVSQILSTDLDTHPDQERKVLAFTNSVQDAAHQAGFLEARNYRFTFRTSLQRVINEALVKSGNPTGTLTLANLSEQFKTFWKQHADPTGQQPLDAYYYRFFPTDYLGRARLDDYRLPGRQGFLPRFEQEFDCRIDWEVAAEFGYNALIGRTLEKTGSAGVVFDESLILQVAEQLRPWLIDNQMEAVEPALLPFFINLLLHRLRTRGGIVHPFMDKFRRGKFDLFELNWRKDGRHFLNPYFGRNTRRVRLLTAQPATADSLDSTFSSKGNNYFHAYFRKTFQMAPSHPNAVNAFYEQLITALTDTGLLDAIPATDKYQTLSHGLITSALRVGKTVQKHQCNRCGHTLTTHTTDTLTDGGRCLTFRCTGTYSTIPATPDLNYYQAVYNRQRSPRIHATEHTGLLDRPKREAIEVSFRKRPHFDSYNALVATSTLEMGIDIGTLNVVLNHNTAPRPGNFLQRIGRAGRQTGSALVVNFVPNKAHDLFYFAQPGEMMLGEVTTPGCFLEAGAILKRHFMAYCLDSWTAADPVNHRIPSLLMLLRLGNTNLNAPDFWANRIINYIKAHENALFDRFAARYWPDLSDATLTDLKYRLQNDTLYEEFREVFGRLQNEMRGLRQKRREVVNYIKTKKLGDQDEEKKLLDAEVRQLYRQYRGLEKRNLLEHLTNVGVLPNYAFPETGVELNARILGATSAESGKPPLDYELTLVRPAQQALRELAPGSHFHTQGFRLPISGLLTHEWSDPAIRMRKRFCSVCDMVADDVGPAAGLCPKCGHPSWQDSANVHTVVKLTAVRSVVRQSDATLEDSRDERDADIYRISRHFHFPAEGVRGAYAMRQIPFGIEFVRNVALTEINLGRHGVINARHLSINGHEHVPVQGFITCRHCGKSTSHEMNLPDYSYHYPYCAHRQATYAGQSDTVFDEVYLCRQLPTEALKILLPVQEVNSSATLAIFRAGFQLGLNRYYQGAPDHLALSDYSEYNPKTSRQDHYLVLYDTIPGGTGYLEKLFRPEAFMAVLERAYETVRDCSCQHEGHDGCYKCLYAYGNQYDRAELSRHQAEQFFGRIVREQESWDRLMGSLSAVSATGQIEESELEDRFVRSLQKRLGANQFEAVQEGGVVCYRFTVADGANSFGYFMRPQVELGPSQGVRLLTRTDFLLTCTTATLNGKQLTDKERLQIPRMAIYLDGYQFHATAQNPRFRNDVARRNAVAETGQYQVWTLTWQDLERFDAGLVTPGLDGQAPPPETIQDELFRRLKQDGFTKTTTSLIQLCAPKAYQPIWQARNNMERLLCLLAYPLRDNHQQGSWSLLLACYQAQLFSPSFDTPSAHRVATFTEPLTMQPPYIRGKAQLTDGYMLANLWPDNTLFQSRLLVNLSGQPPLTGLRETAGSDDLDRADWQAFWWIHNLSQFGQPGQAPTEVAVATSLDELLTYYDEPYHELVRQLHAQGIAFGEDGSFFLLGEQGEQLAEAVLGFEKAKIVIAPLDVADRKAFLNAGYQIQTLDTFSITDLPQ
ncbi:DEAD/DEAH box helicase [Rudanella paleaurantiibacter]|uniref:DEAD/DEAH box helicase n=1 Tax=Rudanella paleaurantiibacter TaxID=2614655 RepID=A0A7J5TSR2_9BACT|nr:DEAD/DEAH box helicase [Rudanella paleaurantiibacter]KAB7726632.1 DEAD/DEAH box helicase [Rudanella paleaurantiibacter]